MKPLNRHCVHGLMLACLQACSSDHDGSPRVDDAVVKQGEASDAGEVSANPGCSRGMLEDDLPQTPLAGPGIVDGRLTPGQYIVSTTYLQLKPDAAAQSRFVELVGPVIADLRGRDGLLATALAQSNHCGTARTLSVWRDEAAMYDFVTSPAHAAAAAAISELSPGGSVVMHWSDTEQGANWAVAAEHAGALQGPSY